MQKCVLIALVRCLSIQNKRPDTDFRGLCRNRSHRSWPKTHAALRRKKLAAFRTSLLRSLDKASGKILRLAVAIPAAHYGWRPMDGVGTVRDVLVHVTETNLMLGNRLGTKPPAQALAEAQAEAERILKPYR